MFCRNFCLGLGMISIGAGFIVGLLIKSGWIAFFIGLALIGSGICICKRC